MNEATFINELKKINIILNKEQQQNINIYKEMLKEENQNYNLTSLIKDEEIYLKHFYDSLTITKVVDFSSDLKILDIGTGAGFPGLILKIVFPSIKITLLDSNSKKVEFLKKVIKKLDIKDIEIVNNRAEEYTKKNKEKFDIITSRAVAKTNVLLEIGINALKINGRFIFYKGNIENEIKDSKNAIKTLNTKIEKIETFLLPIENSKRNIIVIRKYKQNPIQYPRNFNQIIKKPL